jgi:hypothetical protein
MWSSSLADAAGRTYRSKNAKRHGLATRAGAGAAGFVMSPGPGVREAEFTGGAAEPEATGERSDGARAYAAPA